MVRRAILIGLCAVALWAGYPARHRTGRARGCVEQYCAGSGRLIEPGELIDLELAFAAAWGVALPITSNGQDAVHARMGMNHAGRLDVGLAPGGIPGRWIQDWLRARSIPYFAFARACRGRSTGPHIHIGPASEPMHTGAGCQRKTTRNRPLSRRRPKTH